VRKRMKKDEMKHLLKKLKKPDKNEKSEKT